MELYGCAIFNSLHLYRMQSRVNINVFSEIFGDAGEEEELLVSERTVGWMDLCLLAKEEESTGRWQA